jgi:MoxR-like ATPase
MSEMTLTPPAAAPEGSVLTPEQIEAQAADFRNRFDTLKSEVQKMMVGQDEVLEHTLTAILAGGHVLLEGVPGLGKTMLVRSLANALQLTFQRIQFTPDLMPADLIGTNVLIEDHDGRNRFEFSPGPIFCNLLLGDEINRATPKTQSALLEAMQEHSVTVAGQTRKLEAPFFVLATQNPLEMEGTYPLPEAQLDRFFFKLKVPYPTAQQFGQILDRTTERSAPTVGKVFDGKALVGMGSFARGVPIAPTVRERVVELIMATHPETPGIVDDVKRYVRYGASPRAGQALILAGKIRALRQGRYHVSTEDILHFAHSVLRHRVMLSFEAQADSVTDEQLLEGVIRKLREKWK